MCTVEDAANPYTSTPAKVLFRMNDQHSWLEHHRIRSGAQHDADCLSFLEVAVNTGNEGIPIGIRHAVRYDVPDIGGRPIDENVSLHTAVFVQDKKGSNYADSSDDKAFQQQYPQAHICPAIDCKFELHRWLTIWPGDVECLNLEPARV